MHIHTNMYNININKYIYIYPPNHPSYVNISFHLCHCLSVGLAPADVDLGQGRLCRGTGQSKWDNVVDPKFMCMYMYIVVYMEYLSTFTNIYPINEPNVGKYTIWLVVYLPL